MTIAPGTSRDNVSATFPMGKDDEAAGRAAESGGTGTLPANRGQSGAAWAALEALRLRRDVERAAFGTMWRAWRPRRTVAR